MMPLYLYSFAHSIPVLFLVLSNFVCFGLKSSNEDREPHDHIRSSLGCMACSQLNERRMLVHSRSSFSVLVVVESLAY